VAEKDVEWFSGFYAGGPWAGAVVEQRSERSAGIVRAWAKIALQAVLANVRRGSA
jgi:hypothetical protein